MNLLILKSEQFTSSTSAQLTEAQSRHLTTVLRTQVGDSIKIGLLNGNVGSAVVTHIGVPAQITITHLDTAPPPVLPLALILALPRPQMIKRILQTVACMGVQQLHLIQTSRVEKSFWSSPSVSDQAIEEQLILGLEQGMATQLPVVKKHPRFRPFVEDILPTLSHKNQLKLIAHPGDYENCPDNKRRLQTLLAIGPEGGFLEQEVDKFVCAGFNPIQLGARILKVETAVTVLLGKLDCNY